LVDLDEIETYGPILRSDFASDATWLVFKTDFIHYISKMSLTW
jgi:hypothetical protein